MGMDAVFSYTWLTNYYKSGDAFWLDDAALFRITNKAALMKPTLIGKAGPSHYAAGFCRYRHSAL